MSSSSRHSSISPVKSRSNTPLQLKSDNVKKSRSTSPLKKQYSNDGENTMMNIPSTAMKTTYLSPTKSPLRNSIQSPLTQLRKKSKFTIYQDEVDYRSTHITPVKLPQPDINCFLTPEQDDDKENTVLQKKTPIIAQQSEQQRRIPLCDLDIRLFPGFIQPSASTKNVLAARFQLTESYKPEQTKYKNLPSFVTPPRKKLTNVKYEFKTTTRKNLTSSLRKSNSFDNRISKPFITKKARDLEFSIFKDNILSKA